MPDLQARQYLSRIMFKQDGAPPYISHCVKDGLKTRFSEERVISRYFPYSWSLRSPDLNPCDFWLWRHLKYLVSRENPRNLPDLKDSISQHVRNTFSNALHSAVEHLRPSVPYDSRWRFTIMVVFRNMICCNKFYELS